MSSTKAPKAEPPHRSSLTMRIGTLTALISLPAALIVLLIASDISPSGGLLDLQWAVDIAGLALLGLSVIAMIIVMRSQLGRIGRDDNAQLDERETDLRRRAFAFSYRVFTTLALAGAVYMSLVGHPLYTRFILWVPTTSSHWYGIFYVGLLYAWVLPIAYLAWAGPAPLDEDVEDAVEG